MPIVIYNKDSNLNSIGSIQLTKGNYEFEFDANLIPDFVLPSPSKYNGKEYKILGKRFVVSSITYLRNEKNQVKTIILKLEIIENPLPLLAVIGIIGGLLSFAIVLREVRFFAKDAPVSFGILILILGFLAYSFRSKIL